MKRRLLSLPLLLASAAAAAQASPPPTHRPPLTLEALAARVEELERALAAREVASSSVSTQNDELRQRVAVLERQLELQDEAAASAKASNPVLTVNDKGVAAKSADGAYEFKLRGTVQADQRSFLEGDGGQNDSFLWRIVRPTLEGQLGKLVAFKITPDFAGDTPSLVDAYVDLRFDPRATLRVGKFNGPIGLERLQSSSSLAMMERAFPTELAPNRDIGVQLQGEFAEGRVSYAAGAFNGAADGRDASASDPDDEVEFEGRVFFEPWKNSANALSGLGFGLAGSTGDKRGAGNNFLPRYRTPGQNVFFNYRASVFADGSHERLSPQFYYYRNRLGLMGEWIRSGQEVQVGANASTHGRLENRAWQLTAGWVLTGEDCTYRGASKPSHPFALDGEGWGAVELVARYGELEVDEDAFPVYADPSVSARRAQAWGLGINWYLTGNLKLVLNYTDASFDGGAPLGADRPDEEAVFSRLQVSF
jgi:phosphate-selective porin OprO/OprP